MNSLRMKITPTGARLATEQAKNLTRKQLCEALLDNQHFQTNRNQSGFALDSIKSGDIIPMALEANKSVKHLELPDETSRFTHGFEADFEAFNLDQKMHQMRSSFAHHQTIQQLNAQSPEIDPDLLSTLQALTTTIHHHYPINPDVLQKKNALMDKQSIVKLSTVFANGAHACAEICALAHHSLSKLGIKCTYVGGDMLSGTDEKHAYLTIEHKGKSFIFDPTNPMRSPDGALIARIFALPSGTNSSLQKAQETSTSVQNIFDPNDTMTYGISKN